ncbi:MAG: hypothetical protein Q7S86_02200 [bacterium]|nr:hypothetical protein [bacterium]
MAGKEKSKKISTDDLAILINRGFERVETKINDVESGLTSKIDSVDERLTSVRDELVRKLDGTNARIDDLAFNRVKYSDFDLLKKDVEVLKTKFESKHLNGR